MPFPLLDRSKLHLHSLDERVNKMDILRHAVSPESEPTELSGGGREIMAECVKKICAARDDERPVMLAFGAHAIKNGLAPILIRLIEEGWITLMATNGGSTIHDWEFAYQGLTGEDVRSSVEHGHLGIAQETGFYLNLALVVGAYEGFGYGESIGRMIDREGMDIPSLGELIETARDQVESNPDVAAAAIDLAATIRQSAIKPGFLSVPHACKSFSVQAAAWRLKVPFTVHPMIGHDLIYNHPANHCAAIGRTAQRDFLAFAHQVRQLDGGVYLSVGSAVMSPMIFEKALSMAQNLEMQAGERIGLHHIVVVDLAESTWDWQADGEPPANNPAYYVRYCKTFSRMGGTMRYLSADNRDFFLTLLQQLRRTNWQSPWIQKPELTTPSAPK
jgi:hypothetical protein